MRLSPLIWERISAFETPAPRLRTVLRVGVFSGHARGSGYGSGPVQADSCGWAPRHLGGGRSGCRVGGQLGGDLVVAGAFGFAACLGLVVAVFGGFSVCRDGGSFAVEVFVSTLVAVRLVAAQGVGGAFRGDRFDVLALLLDECFCFRTGC